MQFFPLVLRGGLAVIILPSFGTANFLSRCLMPEGPHPFVFIAFTRACLAGGGIEINAPNEEIVVRESREFISPSYVFFYLIFFFPHFFTRQAIHKGTM